MFLTSKTIDIFNTQTIDVPTLEAGMGVVRLGGCLHSHTFICPHMFGCPPVCLNAPTHLYTPCAPMYICMFLGVAAYDMAMGVIYTPCIECLEDDTLELSIYT